MPSVPKSCFPIWLFFLHRDVHHNLGSRLKSHLRFSQIGICAKLRGTADAADIDRVGHHRPGPLDTAFRTYDGDVHWVSVITGDLVTLTRRGKPAFNRHH